MLHIPCLQALPRQWWRQRSRETERETLIAPLGCIGAGPSSFVRLCCLSVHVWNDNRLGWSYGSSPLDQNPKLFSYPKDPFTRREFFGSMLARGMVKLPYSESLAQLAHVLSAVETIFSSWRFGLHITNSK